MCATQIRGVTIGLYMRLNRQFLFDAPRPTNSIAPHFSRLSRISLRRSSCQTGDQLTTGITGLSKSRKGVSAFPQWLAVEFCQPANYSLFLPQPLLAIIKSLQIKPRQRLNSTTRCKYRPKLTTKQRIELDL